MANLVASIEVRGDTLMNGATPKGVNVWARRVDAFARLENGGYSIVGGWAGVGTVTNAPQGKGEFIVNVSDDDFGEMILVCVDMRPADGDPNDPLRFMGTYRLVYVIDTANAASQAELIDADVGDIDGNTMKVMIKSDYPVVYVLHDAVDSTSSIRGVSWFNNKGPAPASQDALITDIYEYLKLKGSMSDKQFAYKSRNAVYLGAACAVSYDIVKRRTILDDVVIDNRPDDGAKPQRRKTKGKVIHSGGKQNYLEFTPSESGKRLKVLLPSGYMHTGQIGRDGLYLVSGGGDTDPVTVLALLDHVQADDRQIDKWQALFAHELEKLEQMVQTARITKAALDGVKPRRTKKPKK